MLLAVAVVVVVVVVVVPCDERNWIKEHVHDDYHHYLLEQLEQLERLVLAVFVGALATAVPRRVVAEAGHRHLD